MDLGKTIAKLRRENGISQEKLAEMVGVSRQAVTKWENGKTNPDTENLIRLGEIFGVSVDELCRGKAAEKQEPKIHPAGHIFAAFSAAALIGYTAFGLATDCFDGETFILLLILALPMHIFTHLVFWGMVKSGDFSMIAGYDPKVEYNTENLKRYIAGLDFMLGMTGASYIFLIAATALIAPRFDIRIFLLFGYIISFVAGILFMGYKFGDKIYADPKDAENAKRRTIPSVIVLAEILFSCGVFVFAFEQKGYKNNTLEPFPMLGMMFLSVILALAGYFCENKRLEKADEHAPFFGKAFIVLNLCAAAALVLMVML